MRPLSFLFFFFLGLHISKAAHGDVLSASWSSPVDLSYGLAKAQSPRISISSDGAKATAVWSRGNDSTARVTQSSSATISGNTAIWGAPINLSSTASATPVPQVSLSSDGTKATAVWSGPSGAVQASSATIVGNAATWASPSDLSGTGASGQQVSVSADGTKAVAVWVRSNGSNNIVQASLATIVGNVALWSSPIDLSAPFNDSSSPDISISSDGARATAVWVRFNGSNYMVQASSATILGNVASWATPRDLSTSAQNAISPQVSLSGDGSKSTAVWSLTIAGSVPTLYVVQASSATIFGNSASWSSPLTLSMPSRSTAVRVGLSADGTKATSIFTFSDGTNGTVQTSSSTIDGNTATWATPVNLSTVGQNAGSANIGVSSDGTRATAIWQREASLTTAIVQTSSAEIYGNLAIWGSPIDVFSGSDLSNTRLALSAEGTVATGIWQAGNPTVVKSATAQITYPASVPTLSEWSQMLLGLLVITMIGWHFHKQRSY